MNRPASIAVVVGSTRPARICLDIATWVCGSIQASSPLRYELLDLADVGLPLLDEPLKASLQTYKHEHTKRWSERVQAFDGFLFVTPQYNWGYPAVLKNALDYLYVEWHDKPATVLTYGTHGGGKAAKQLQEVLVGLHMRLLPEHIEAAIGAGDLDSNWQLVDVEATLAPIRSQLRTLDGHFSEAALAVDSDLFADGK
ncbi:MAG: NADPH-dependent FMN reductase [Candidatus Nanopelagicales bacterium]